MKKLMSKEFKIGMSVIVALVILFFGIEYLKGVNLFKPANFYYAEYDNVAGLEIAAPVNIDGFKVGQVRDIEFNYENPGKIRVLLALDKKLRLAVDSKAIISSSLLGSASIDIIPGKSSEKLAVGSNIETTTSTDLMASISENLMPQIGSILPKVDSLLYNLNLLVADPALARSIGRFDGISDNILATTVGLRTTMNTQVPMIMGNAARITTNLDTVTSGLGQLSKQLRSLPLEPTMANLNDLTSNLSEFSSQLNDKNSTLGLLMSDPELYRQLNRVAADVDSLLVDIQKNPKRYISIKLL
jgi:phospholipid/cholesterol/gamma-HCH transport system substrate-binding protein